MLPQPHTTASISSPPAANFGLFGPAILNTRRYLVCRSNTLRYLIVNHGSHSGLSAVRNNRVRNRVQHDRLHWQSTAILSLVLSLASIYVLFSALWAVSTRGFQYGLVACCALAIIGRIASLRHCIRCRYWRRAVFLDVSVHSCQQSVVGSHVACAVAHTLCSHLPGHSVSPGWQGKDGERGV